MAISNAYSEGVGPKFKSLQTLQIRTSLALEWVVNLSGIRILDLSTLTVDILLLELLRHPGTSPNPSTIKSDGCPFWGLLFEVLRQRNTTKIHPL
jgi:hypothetical protein